MNERTKAALNEEMPSIIRYINRIIASNPDLREAGLKYNGLLLTQTELNQEVTRDHDVFMDFIQPQCDEFKFCISNVNEKIKVVWCADENCPSGFHEE